MNLPKKPLLWFGVALAISAGLPLLFFVTLGFLLTGWPLWHEEPGAVAPVGDTSTFEESAECLFLWYSYDRPEWDQSELLDRREGRLVNHAVAACFPTQRAATQLALIACFNEYQRQHQNRPTDDVDWPEHNLEGCTWDGLATDPVPYDLAFGDVVAVPAVPRAGKRFMLTIGVTGRDSVVADVNDVIRTDALDVSVTIGDNDSPLSFEHGADRDGDIYVELMVPRSAEGMRLTVTLTLAAHTPTGEKVVTFTVGR